MSRQALFAKTFFVAMLAVYPVVGMIKGHDLVWYVSGAFGILATVAVGLVLWMDEAAMRIQRQSLGDQANNIRTLLQRIEFQAEVINNQRRKIETLEHR